MAGVKICGLSDEASVDAALEGGARYIGFVFFAKSPRNIAHDRAAALAARIRGRADIVALTVDADDGALETIRARLAPDYIQAHGQEPPARVASMQRFASKGIIKVLHVARAADLAAADAYLGPAAMLMFEAKPPEGADRPGGNGMPFDWGILKGQRFTRPWLLAGGLTPENVSEAIATSGAQLVDVSSGVEKAPGIKDPLRIEAFLAAAGATD